MLAVFTQTNPGPPPGAAVFAAAAAAGPSFFAPDAPPAGVGAGSDATGAPAGVGAPIAGTAFASGAGAGIAVAEAAYHVCTPLCPRHAPLFEAVVAYVPSLQIPFAPAGAPAGACANAVDAAITHSPANVQTVWVIVRILGWVIGWVIVWVIAKFSEAAQIQKGNIAILAGLADRVTGNAKTPAQSLARRPISVSSTAVTTPFSHWLIFHAALVLLLAAELVYSRWGLARLSPEARPRRQHRNAIAATIMWTAAALGLGVTLLVTLGHPAATQFLAGYAIEESLSVDNLFVFLLLFRLFGIPETFQPRVLFWGVLGAIVLRGLFIAAGLGLLARFHWVSYVFALVLLAASIRLLLPQRAEDPETARQAPTWVRWISKIHPVSLRHDVFLTREPAAPGLAPRPMITMLFLALIAIETADIVFALDSIPAVLSITRAPFLAYTSNILAVMGLRSLYFLLAHMFKKLHYLHFGLAFVLLFASAKMLLADWLEIGPLTSLAVIVAILAVTVTASLASNQRHLTTGNPAP